MLLKKMRKRFTKQSSVLSAKEKRAERGGGRWRSFREMSRLVAEARTELQKKENELTNAILKDVGDIVDAIGYGGLCGYIKKRGSSLCQEGAWWKILRVQL